MHGERAREIENGKGREGSLMLGLFSRSAGDGDTGEMEGRQERAKGKGVRREDQASPRSGHAGIPGTYKALQRAISSPRALYAPRLSCDLYENDFASGGAGNRAMIAARN